MTLIANDLLTDVSLHLVEARVSTTLGSNVVAFGVATVTPGSLVGIYVGAQLIVGAGAQREIVTVFAVNPPTFTATFAKTHLPTDVLYAATFPSGQTDHPLFTQTEMLNYLLEAENDFLLRVRPVYASALLPYVVGNRFYPQPADAIRVERIAVGGLDLQETTQSDLDLENPNWPSDTGVLGDPSGGPTDAGKWFRDQIDTAQVGFYPLPQQAGSAEVWYSQKDVGPLNLLSTLVVQPDIFMRFIVMGVLARAWSKDGESRDPNRAKFCSKAFDFGVMLAQRFMEEVGVQPQQGQSKQDFSPMAVGA